MKKFGILLALAFNLSVLASSQQQSAGIASDRMAQFTSGLGDHHHGITTSRPQTQVFFDQGLKLIYAFNHEEAEHAFWRAAEHDPNAAMAYWGIAYAAGPNYTLPVDAAHEKTAYDAIQKAVLLSPQVTESERAYIQALAKRYTNNSNPNFQQLSLNYKQAMPDVSQRYHDDLDDATIYAESIMDLNP